MTVRLDAGQRIEVAPGMGPFLEAAGIHALDDLLNPLLGAPIAWSRSSWVCRVPAGARALYVKCFVYPTAKDVLLRVVSRRLFWHRARREWRSIGIQERLGLPVVTRVCIGETKHHGILRAAVIATEDVPGAERLDRWLREAQRPDAPVTVARYVALLHRSGFIHGDLNARNVLVRETGAVDLRNVDSAHGRRSVWRRRLTPDHLRDVAPLALAFRVILGREAEQALVEAYLADVGVASTAGLERGLEAEIARISARELRRLAVLPPALNADGDRLGRSKTPLEDGPDPAKRLQDV